MGDGEEGSVIKTFWSIVLDDQWSKKICKPMMIVRSMVLHASLDDLVSQHVNLLNLMIWKLDPKSPWFYFDQAEYCIVFLSSILSPQILGRRVCHKTPPTLDKDWRASFTPKQVFKKKRFFPRLNLSSWEGAYDTAFGQLERTCKNRIV